MPIRLKSIIVFSLASFAGTFFLWTFSIFYVTRNWSLFWDGFSLFYMIVAVLVVVSDIILWFALRPVSGAEVKIRKETELTDDENIRLERVKRILPLIIFITNGIGYLIGPLIKRVLTAIAAGQDPWNLVTLTSVIYSLSVGLYIAFIEIRLLEGFLQPIRVKQGRKSMDFRNKKRWSRRQFELALTIMVMVFGLFYSAGQGYVLEDLYAPAQAADYYEPSAETEAVSAASESTAEEVSAASDSAAWGAGSEEVPAAGGVDTVSAASRIILDRMELWQKALRGEQLNLDEHHPQIQGRLAEFTFKMLLLGLIVSVLSILAVAVETRTTDKRMKEMNLRMQEISEGNVDDSRKMIIIREDELGETSHWINIFIDRQASIMNTIRSSISSLDGTSGELTGINSTAEQLSRAVESGITSVRTNIDQQHKVLDGLKDSIAQLGETIRNTNNNLRNQNDAMGTNTSAVEEMTANIGSVARNSQEAYSNTQTLIGDAEKSGEDMNILQKGISEIAESTGEVGRSMAEINKIAAQTNLLAMNAAIEAAHAGDVGAGFAVVAAEVRKLAEDSALTSKSITELTKKMNQLSSQGLEQADNAKSSFGSIQERVKHNALIISEISESMREQEQGSLEMQRAMETLRDLTADVASITEIQNEQRINVESGMERLTGAADEIQVQMDRIFSLMGDFETFVTALGTVIDRNTALVRELKNVSGV